MSKVQVTNDLINWMIKYGGDVAKPLAELWLASLDYQREELEKTYSVFFESYNRCFRSPRVYEDEPWTPDSIEMEG